MGISVGGIVSGIDTDALIAGIVASYSTPKTIMKAHKADLEEAQEAFAGLSSRLDSLKEAIEAFDTTDELLARSTTSADEDVVTVEASAGAITGTYSVKVNVLAASATQMSQGYADKTTADALGSGTLSVTYGSTVTAVTVDAGATMEDVAAAINDQVDGVTAYVMYTGDATTPYRLVIAGDDTGASNTISLDTSGLSGGTAPTFTETSTALDASIEINGVTITDSDNEIDEAISGVTFTAESVSATAVTVTVAADVTAMADLLSGMADAYNSVLGYIAQNRVYNADENIKGPFVSDNLVSGLRRSLASMFSAQSTAGSSLTSLAELGLTTASDGTLTFDEDVFTTAYADHPDDVVGILTDSSNSVSGKFTALIDLYTDATDGRLTERGTSLETQIETADDRITRFEAQMAKYEARLNRQFTAMEIALGALDSAKSQLTALFKTTSSSES